MMDETLIPSFYQIYTVIMQLLQVEYAFDTGHAPQELLHTLLDLTPIQQLVPPPLLVRLHQDTVRVLNDWLIIVGLACTDVSPEESTTYRWESVEQQHMLNYELERVQAIFRQAAAGPPWPER